jgi:hypothetical protein
MIHTRIASLTAFRFPAHKMIPKSITGANGTNHSGNSTKGLSVQWKKQIKKNHTRKSRRWLSRELFRECNSMAE